MDNHLTEFDKLIKGSFENFEVPYEPAHWEELERELRIVSPGIGNFYGAITTGLVATSVIFLSLMFFVSDAGHGDNHAATTIEETVEDLSSGNAGQGETLYLESADSADHSLARESSEIEAPISALASNASKNVISTGSNMGTEPNLTTESSEPAKAAKNNVRTGCTGLTINFVADQAYGNDAKYLWNFGDGYFSNDPSPSHTFNKEGTFDVSLSVTSPSSGQITSNVVQTMIEIVEAPLANMNLAIVSGSKVEVHNNSYASERIEWELNNERQQASEPMVINLSAEENTYNVKLVAYNEAGCEDISVKPILVNPAYTKFATALVPGTVFTPGDQIKNGKVTDLKVYSADGKTLVYTAGANKSWKGQQMDGSTQKGEFKWVMLVETANAGFEVYSGKITMR